MNWIKDVAEMDFWELIMDDKSDNQNTMMLIVHEVKSLLMKIEDRPVLWLYGYNDGFLNHTMIPRMTKILMLLSNLTQNDAPKNFAGYISSNHVDEYVAEFINELRCLTMDTEWIKCPNKEMFLKISDILGAFSNFSNMQWIQNISRNIEIIGKDNQINDVMGEIQCLLLLSEEMLYDRANHDPHYPIIDYVESSTEWYHGWLYPDENGKNLILTGCQNTTAAKRLIKVMKIVLNQTNLQWMEKILTSEFLDNYMHSNEANVLKKIFNDGNINLIKNMTDFGLLKKIFNQSKTEWMKNTTYLNFLELFFNESNMGWIKNKTLFGFDEFHIENEKLIFNHLLQIQSIILKESIISLTEINKSLSDSQVIPWRSILPQIPPLTDFIFNILKSVPAFLEEISELVKNNDYELVSELVMETINSSWPCASHVIIDGNEKNCVLHYWEQLDSTQQLMKHVNCIVGGPHSFGNSTSSSCNMNITMEFWNTTEDQINQLSNLWNDIISKVSENTSIEVLDKEWFDLISEHLTKLEVTSNEILTQMESNLNEVKTIIKDIQCLSPFNDMTECSNDDWFMR